MKNAFYITSKGVFILKIIKYVLTWLKGAAPLSRTLKILEVFQGRKTMEKCACTFFRRPIFKDGNLGQVEKQSHFLLPKTNFVYQNQTLLQIYYTDFVIVTFNCFLFLTIIIFIKLSIVVFVYIGCAFSLNSTSSSGDSSSSCKAIISSRNLFTP